jgi:hypothetical protein
MTRIISSPQRDINARAETVTEKPFFREAFKPPREQVRISCARWMRTRSRDDEKPVSGCNGVTQAASQRRSWSCPSRQAIENFFWNVHSQNSFPATLLNYPHPDCLL